MTLQDPKMDSGKQTDRVLWGPKRLPKVLGCPKIIHAQSEK